MSIGVGSHAAPDSPELSLTSPLLDAVVVVPASVSPDEEEDVADELALLSVPELALALDDALEVAGGSPLLPSLPSSESAVSPTPSAVQAKSAVAPTRNSRRLEQTMPAWLSPTRAGAQSVLAGRPRARRPNTLRPARPGAAAGASSLARAAA